MKNIHSALDSQETEAWQKLIRVLTHEIMNSITPIISLTELLSRQIEETEGLMREQIRNTSRCSRPSADAATDWYTLSATTGRFPIFHSPY